MMADAFHEDQLALGLKADGIAGIISTGLAGSVAWLLSRFTPFEPAIGAFGGSLIGAISYVVFAMNRNKKRLEDLTENEELRKKMALQYSSKLSEVDESSTPQEWKKIQLEISSSVLTESNQRILERELIVEHNISETINVSGVAEEKYGELYAMKLELEKQLKQAKEIEDEDKQRILTLENDSIAQKILKNGLALEIPELLDLGDATLKIGEMEMSNGYYSQSQRKSRNTGDLENEALAVKGLIRLSEMKKDFVKQEEFALRLVDIWTMVDNKSGLADALIRVGDAFKRQGKNEQAEQKYLKSSSLADEIGEKDLKYFALHRMTLLEHLGTKRFFEINSQLSELFNDAFSRDISDTTKNEYIGQDPYSEAEILELSGWMEARNGNLVEANRLTRESLLLSRKHGYRPMEADVLASLARIAESQGNTEMAKIHKQESQKILTEIGLPINEEE
jgi:tetratricopeptide (TPR) repeat protein